MTPLKQTLDAFHFQNVANKVFLNSTKPVQVCGGEFAIKFVSSTLKVNISSKRSINKQSSSSQIFVHKQVMEKSMYVCVCRILLA